MIVISRNIKLADTEVDWQFVRAGGPGGQHVNKASTAVRLVFDIKASSLPEDCKQRLLARDDHRVTDNGRILIKCQASRSQHANREAALNELKNLIKSALVAPKKRIPTKPSRASRERRLQKKKHRSDVKALRRQKPLR